MRAAAVALAAVLAGPAAAAEVIAVPALDFVDTSGEAGDQSARP